MIPLVGSMSFKLLVSIRVVLPPEMNSSRWWTWDRPPGSADTRSPLTLEEKYGYIYHANVKGDESYEYMIPCSSLSLQAGRASIAGQKYTEIKFQFKYVQNIKMFWQSHWYWSLKPEVSWSILPPSNYPLPFPYPFPTWHPPFKKPGRFPRAKPIHWSIRNGFLWPGTFLGQKRQTSPVTTKAPHWSPRQRALHSVNSVTSVSFMSGWPPSPFFRRWKKMWKQVPHL